MTEWFGRIRRRVGSVVCALVVTAVAIGCGANDGPRLEIGDDTHIVVIGNNLGSRMMDFGYFETELYRRYPNNRLVIRNMSDGGNTPGFRPHSGRVSPWAFPGAERFQSELAQDSGSEGFFETPDEWLTRLGADIVIAFFGYSESFAGPNGVANYKGELDAFIRHTLQQTYNGATPPQLAIVSPIAFENLSDTFDLPDGEKENANLALYTDAMREVSAQHGVVFVDVFEPTKRWFASDDALTIDGFQLTGEGYERLAPVLADGIFGRARRRVTSQAIADMVHEAVLEKNWFWHNDYKIPNGVHVFGRRYDPFGPDNYPAELAKIRQMTAIRDTAIWLAAQEKTFDLAAADQRTLPLPPVETNYNPANKNGSPEYLYGEAALGKLHAAPGYKIELFASESEFADLANPVQLSFDNRGRLWVATMPSYPHYKPGDARPDDKLIILEDTDGDGKADKQTTFADGLHLPIGFEFEPEGVYVSQGTNLILLRDIDGDDHADTREVILSGFDDHDTHHAISAFVADPSGAIYMGEGTFLHTNVETPYGPVRGTNGGFYRYAPRRHHLERTAQLAIPNPWGIAFDEWGQNIFAETSGPAVRWMLPGSIKPRYGRATDKSFDLIEEAHKVRPTSGLEFVSSRHFPDTVQGDMLINNTIGFLGTKQHQITDDGTGYVTRHRQDLVWGDDPNFRPVDMEFAPDGSLYIIDWHNVLIGHMQHNARDPLRDHVHGRIYRVTYPSRPLVVPAEVAGASIETLLDNLKLPEYRTRYRTRRELRGRAAADVLPALKRWVASLDRSDPRYEHHALEALWVSWGLDVVDQDLLRQLLRATDYRARAAAVRVLRYTNHQVKDQAELLKIAAADDEGRVRLEAIAAASWLADTGRGLEILEAAATKPLDKWIAPAYETAVAHLNGRAADAPSDADAEAVPATLATREQELFIAGREIYGRDGYCGTCHQPDGRGLRNAGFPGLAGSEWVVGNEERLIKLTLKGLLGPIEVQGRQYPGNVPMMPFEGLLGDEEMAAILTFVRNSFGNEASAITPEQVAAVRASAEGKVGFYSPDDLLQEHPME